MFQLPVKQKVQIEIEAETFNILCAIAKASGKTPDELLKMLTAKYKQMNAVERWGMIQFGNPVPTANDKSPAGMVSKTSWLLPVAAIILLLMFSGKKK